MFWWIGTEGSCYPRFMRFQRFAALAVLLVLPWAAVGCGAVARVTKGAKDRIGKIGSRSDAEKANAEGAEPAPALAPQIRGGTIRLVRDSLGFVLIESSGTPPPPKSEITVVRGSRAEPVAQLRVSPEAKTGFVVADILTGEPRAGDVVMWSRPVANTANQPVSDLPDLPPPPLTEMPPLSPDVDPRNLRPLPEIGAGGSQPGDAPMTDAESELERELRAIGGPAPEF